jgi:nucleoside-diphosphate-sugar epimerase
VAEGILACMGRNGFEVFNLSGNELITFGKVIEESAALLNRRPKVVENNAHILNVRNPDNRKIQRATTWSPRIDLRQGLSTLLAP